MNGLARISRRSGRQLVELPDGIEVSGDTMQVRVVGRTIVLEPMPEAGVIAPGSYTLETLPPLGDGARKILASVDAAVARAGDVEAGTKKMHAASGITLDDEGLTGLGLSDEGLPGLDPGD